MITAAGGQIDAAFTFGEDTALPSFGLQMVVVGRASGLGYGDNVNIYQWNYTTSSWDTLVEEISNRASDSTTRNFLRTDADHISGDQLKLRFKNSGIDGAPILYIDQLNLERLLVSGEGGAPSWSIIILSSL